MVVIPDFCFISLDLCYRAGGSGVWLQLANVPTPDSPVSIVGHKHQSLCVKGSPANKEAEDHNR